LLAINGNARLAVNDLPADHPAQESLREIAKAGARATELVRRILSFSRPRESKREPLELRPVVEEALKLLRSTLPAMVEIKLTTEGSLPVIEGDAGAIHQVVMNLVTNAAHAIGDRSGTIEVKLEAVIVSEDQARLSGDLTAGAYARMTVSDNGCGMGRAVVERIFDPFFTTKSAGQGTGLGLPVVHGIMRAHHGAVNVYSEPGIGTKFYLYFPVSRHAQAITASEAPASTRPRRERVLYIDDEPALVQLTMRSLTRLGYRVTGFSDPMQALDAFCAAPQDFDVIITDLSMPGMSGFDLARAILAVRGDIPIIVTSGYVRPQDEEAAMNLGVHAIVLKPDTVDELVQALDRLFQSSASSP
jgi:CheY-like chemotaxis protein